jgi:hypothetical protein
MWIDYHEGPRRFSRWVVATSVFGGCLIPSNLSMSVDKQGKVEEMEF